MPKKVFYTHVKGKEYSELLRLYKQLLEKVVDLQESNTDLHNLLTECRNLTTKEGCGKVQNEDLRGV